MEELTLNDLKNFEVGVSFSSVLLSMVFSALCAHAVAIAYRKYATSLGNRISFSQIFWLLASVTTVVITIVKFSLALSLGLVGALSIVRFRAAIKEPEELVYLFLVIALGLAFGANQVVIGLILLLFASLIILITARFIQSEKASHHVGMLIIVSGPKNKVKDIRNNKLSGLITNSSFTILKEVEYVGDTGKLVLKASINDESNNIISRFEDLISDNEINLNVISDVI